ncbi:dihydroorotase [Aspergillus sp. HF37]|nr:dihydroorotase [Aspergillus sp. HF37]
MDLRQLSRMDLPATADMHVHLRQDRLMELVVPYIRHGGVDTVFVMPNLQPPITSVAQALEYKAKLQALEPNVTYLMSLYLNISVTTNSAAGVSTYEDFFAVFAEMEKRDMVLNLHGEVPSTSREGITDLNAEEEFLPTLKMLNERFPKLRIVLEHCTTEAALNAVRSCSESVAATITAHHLYLTVQNKEDPLAFCKPIPKKASDRDALLKAVCGGESKFFFGSDSAPHLLPSKRAEKAPAGVFTQPCVTQYVLLALEEAIERGLVSSDEITQEKVGNFLSRFGRRFYKLPESENRIVLERKGDKIPETIKSQDGSTEVALSRGGDGGVFSLSWKSA